MKYQLLLLCLLLTSCFKDNKTARDTSGFNVRELGMYAFGAKYAQDLKLVQPSESEINALLAGVEDQLKNRVSMSNDQIQTQAESIEDIISQKLEIQAQQNYQTGVEYIENLKNNPDYLTTTSGLVYRVLKEGSSDKPVGASYAVVNYIGRKLDGTVFDQSTPEGGVKFKLEELIPCWQLTLALMQVGARFEVVCPAHLAFGDEGVPPLISGGEVVIFELELLELTNLK